MIKMSAWTRLLRAVIANEPDLPALRPCLLRLRSWIAEHPEEAPRELRRRRALRTRGQGPSRRTRRSARPARRAG